MQVLSGATWLVMLGLCPSLVSCGSKGSDDGGAGASGGDATAGTAGSTGGSAAAAASGGTAGAATPTLQSYDADDPRLQYMGRIDWIKAKAPHFASPGVQLKARFKGTGATIKIFDENRYGTNKNYFEVLVDDQPPAKLTALKTQEAYVVAQGLPDTEHTLIVAKRTEANIGWSSFTGLEVQGELLEPPPRPERRIEIIGDSISCGSGSEAENGSPECSEDGWGQPYHNAYRAYGPVMARALDAEYHVAAVSGIGLVRNYSSMYDARTMPEVYDLMYLEETASKPYDTSLFVPDAVVVALGTNDFSPGDSEREKMTVEVYTEAYIAFVTQLRGYYPDAHIFAISSPMLGDGWPEPTDTSATDLKSALAATLEHFAAEGDDKVHQFNVTKLSGTGCGTHPSAEQQAATAEELGAFIKETLAW